jgi:outer membrane beta-barrel protein
MINTSKLYDETKRINTKMHFAVLAAACVTLFIPRFGLAQSAKSRAPAQQKVDTAEFEKGYWATQEQDVAVIQNRTYSKTKKVLLSAAYGIMVNDSYSDGNVMTGIGQYFWNEKMGVQLTYQTFMTRNNKMTDALILNNGQIPDHNKPKQFYGASFNWVPIYGKMSLLERKVMYFDMSFSPGMGMTTYDQQISSGNKTQQALTYTFDITQHFFVSQHFALRLDYMNRWYTEKKVDYVDNTNPKNTGAELSEDFIHASQIMMGLTFYF